MTGRIAVIVPTVRRAHLLPGLLDSIETSTITPHSVYCVVERDDPATIQALARIDGEHATILGKFGGYVAAANAGVAATSEPFFVVANDDVVFHEGWDLRAIEAMQPDHIRVVGIDQGNGRTDCFFLVDRTYLNGPLYFDGYRSQFCDTEFANRARRRGVWADAQGALIEHKHWTLGKSQVDENYSLAIARGPEDERVYQERSQLWAD